MRILITGGAGFIGSQLGLHLLQRQHDVLFLDNLQFGYIENLTSGTGKMKPKFIKMDIRDKEFHTLSKGIDIIFHLAGISSLPECQSDPNETYQVNVAGTANVLEAARLNNVKRVIFSSSSAVYENESSFPVSEDFKSRPDLLYSLSKIHAEEICHSFQKLYGMDITILRFFNVYGPHMDFKRPNPPFVSYIIKCFLQNKVTVLHSTGSQSRDIIYIDDVLYLCEIVMHHKNAKNQIFNVASGKSYTIKHVYDTVTQAFNKRNNRIIFQDANLLWNLYPKLFKSKYSLKRMFIKKETDKYTLANITKTKKILGWTPKITLEEGIKRTVQFALSKQS